MDQTQVSQYFSTPKEVQQRSAGSADSTSGPHPTIPPDPVSEENYGAQVSETDRVGNANDSNEALQGVEHDTTKHFISWESFHNKSIQSQDSKDADVEVNESPPLSRETFTTEVTAVTVATPSEPDGEVSIMIVEKDWYVLTANEGTSLRVIQTDKNGTPIKVMEDGKEVFLTIPFPSATTVVQERKD